MSILILVGSGEFTEAMSAIDEHIISLLSSEDPHVAIFPTAAGKESDALKWINKGQLHYKKLGIKSFGVPVLKREDAENIKFIDLIKKASVMYFSGGDPGYLLESIHETSLSSSILEYHKNGVVLAGASAGAMICGSVVLSNIQKLTSSSVDPEWNKALNLVPYAIFPHFDLIERDSFIMPSATEVLKEKGYQQWLGIDEDTALVVHEEHTAKVMGKGRVVITKNDSQSVYKDGDTINL